MNNIEKLHTEWLQLQPLKEDLQRRMSQQFMFDFNYNSNHLEGNTLTYGQTKLLLFFGRVQGDGLMRDFEEMKAHNVGLEMMKIEAKDIERPLSEAFIRELNSIILAGDFYKTSRDGTYRYKIHTGVYKTRPNSVITPLGNLFDYASPEETPALMSDLINWYNNEEKQPTMPPYELAALFHYRYIRIHPFEDGNGRIARLLVNFILHRHNYPMIVIPTADRDNYLAVLGKCDNATGALPYDGANAAKEKIQPFIDYISAFVEKKLDIAIQLACGKIKEIKETIEGTEKGTEKGTERLTDNQKLILENIDKSPYITSLELAKIVGIGADRIRRNTSKLKAMGFITRIGSDRNGHWQIVSKKTSVKTDYSEIHDFTKKLGLTPKEVFDFQDKLEENNLNFVDIYQIFKQNPQNSILETLDEFLENKNHLKI